MMCRLEDVGITTEGVPNFQDNYGKKRLRLKVSRGEKLAADYADNSAIVAGQPLRLSRPLSITTLPA
jgi:hypothetical protein